jgi:hypothetical protein
VALPKADGSPAGQQLKNRHVEKDSKGHKKKKKKKTKNIKHLSSIRAKKKSHHFLYCTNSQSKIT